MAITTVNKENGIWYKATGRLKIGQVFRIHPSEAYQGIEEGTIRVLAVGKFGSLGEHNEAAANHYGMLQELLLEIDPLEDYTFVVYKYDNGEVQVLELEEFLDHTTTY